MTTLISFHLPQSIFLSKQILHKSSSEWSVVETDVLLLLDIVEEEFESGELMVEDEEENWSAKGKEVPTNEDNEAGKFIADNWDNCSGLNCFAACKPAKNISSRSRCLCNSSLSYLCCCCIVDCCDRLLLNVCGFWSLFDLWYNGGLVGGVDETEFDDENEDDENWVDTGEGRELFDCNIKCKSDAEKGRCDDCNGRWLDCGNESEFEVELEVELVVESEFNSEGGNEGTAENCKNETLNGWTEDEIVKSWIEGIVNDEGVNGVKDPELDIWFDWGTDRDRIGIEPDEKYCSFISNW